jgi:hypothetical protein
VKNEERKQEPMHFRTIDVHAQAMALSEGGGGLSISPPDR